MRVAVMSDVHANLAALEAVLADAEALHADALWHLGDLVGYGPDPDRVIEIMGIEGAICVMGNHDAAAAGVIGTEWFNPAAARAACWTAETITEASRRWLANLPRIDQEGFWTLAHGTLRDPLFEYLSTFESARGHFETMPTPYSCVGHTHLPLVVREVAPGQLDAFAPGDSDVIELGEERLCFNPGGAGQPRNGDPRASYALLDTDAGSITFRRVDYDFCVTQQRMVEAGLPEPLVARLAVGR
jgi:predicted phosphodiesterase